MLSLGDNWPIIWMTPLLYDGTDASTQAVVGAFNAWFSITFEFGIIAFLFTIVVGIISRS